MTCFGIREDSILNAEVSAVSGVMAFRELTSRKLICKPFSDTSSSQLTAHANSAISYVSDSIALGGL